MHTGDVDLGRDRDPFERTLQALREKVTRNGPLQGAPLPVNVIAAKLGVSPTPVREALSRLTGEGLVAHNAGGYAGVTFDAGGLAATYGLAGILGLAIARARSDATPQGGGPMAFLLHLAGQVDNPALGLAFRRVLAQLAPFEEAERACLTPERWPPEPGEPPELIRRYFARRARRSSAILGAALAARLGPQL